MNLDDIMHKAETALAIATGLDARIKALEAVVATAETIIHPPPETPVHHV